MKTLTILFESPNVFYAVIDDVNIRIDNPELLIEYDGNIIDPCFEAKKCLHDTGIVCKISTVSSCPKVYRDVFAKFNGNRLKPGDIFQVDGFEYELETRFTDGWMPTYNNPDNSGCDVPAEPYEVAILKLAKEEEQEPDIQTSDIHHTFKPHGQFKIKEEEPKELIATEKYYYSTGLMQPLTITKNKRMLSNKKYNKAIDDVLSKYHEYKNNTLNTKKSIDKMLSIELDKIFKEIEKLKK